MASVLVGVADQRLMGGDRRVRTQSIAAVLLLMLAWAGSAAQNREGPPLRIITTAHEAHSLTSEAARRSYPIHLRAVVTFYDPYIDSRHGALFVHDASGSIFAAVPNEPVLPIRAGTLLDVVGVSAPGDYAPIIQQVRVQVLGQSHLPADAPRVTMPQLLAGAEDGQWIEIEGVVHAVQTTDRHAILDLVTAGGPVSATTMRERGVDYEHLIDSLVRLRANAAPVFNHRLQMVGVHLYFPTIDQVMVIQAHPADPFSMPVEPIANLLQFAPGQDLSRRVRVEGTMTLQWPGRMLCIQQASDGLCMPTAQANPLSIGDKVDVVGFPNTSDFKPTLEYATYRATGRGVSLPPIAVTAAQAISGDYDGELVRIDAELIEQDHTASDPTLLLRVGNLLFPAIVPKDSAGSGIPGWREGTRLRIAGICSAQVDAQNTLLREGGVRLKSFQLLLRSLDDVEVVRTPSWWTRGHTLELLGIVAAVALAAALWVIILRRRVEQQTDLIRRNEDRLRHISQHDALTNLPNRTLLNDRLSMALERTRRFRAGLGLLMVDLDHFKEVNDSLGHHAGDQLLCEVATRIRTSVRKTDTVARIGGDEFIVLLPDLQSAGEAEIIARKIVAAVSAPIHLGLLEVPISASVGVCTYPDGGTDAEALLESVDTAMYQAKAQGRNGFRLFTPDMAKATQRKLELESAMRQALASCEFELRYQPIVDLRSNKLVGLEASMYWLNQQLGLVTQEDFLPLAEETGLIVPLGEWTLKEACRQAAEVERRLNRTLLLVVPVYPRQLQQADLVRAIEAALSAHRRPANSLEIEVSENLLMCASLKTSTGLREVRDLGVRLAVDDFGIGFSSLSHIARYRVDHLRIDRSFVRECTTDSRCAAVTRALIAMAGGVGIEAVAEGVETAGQLEFLRSAQCSLAQGDYIGPAMVAAELEGTLASF